MNPDATDVAEPPLSLPQLYRFSTCASVLKNDILLAQPSQHPHDEPPHILPCTVLTLLARVCEVPESVISKSWDTLKHAIWHNHEFTVPVESREALFLKYGHDLGFRMGLSSLMCLH
jgi:hypothetical protein